ncbi:MAG: DUF5320 family protein [Spirochaetales bacterium]|nr:DUF5320 family protein [Spirochaetales bacterium]
MPARNGMGPEGLGPFTGRGLGGCGGRVAVPYGGRGYGAGFGGGFGGGLGRGRGRGFGRGFGAGYGYGPVAGPLAPSDADARDELLARKAAIDSALAAVEARLKTGEGSKDE